MKIRHAAPALLILLAGCSSTPDQDSTDLKISTTEKPVVAAKAATESEAAPDPSNFKPSAAFTLRWRRNIGNIGFSTDQSTNPIVHPGQVRWRMKNDYGDMGNSILRPVVLNGSLYAANAKGKILRLKPDSGEPQWRVDSGITITGGLGAGNGLILAGGEKGEVVAYDESGKLRWQAKVSSEVLGTPQVAGEIVVVRSGDGRIAGLNIANGKRKWLYEHAMPALVVRSSAGVTIRNGTIFAGFAGGKLAAIDLASGNLKWEAALSEPRGNTELERISDITSAPQVDNEVVCAASFQGQVGCFNVSQGGKLWAHEFSSDKGLTLSGKYLYAVNASGEVFAMSKSTGSSAWKNAQLGTLHTAAPVVLGDFLIVGEKEGYLYALRREDGSIAARFRTDGSPIQGASIELNGGLLAQTRKGGLYSVTLH
ncbi:MAG TPA: outer membrane protein assembly factor BamB [Gallionellaceae bacterium]